ncbi:MAG: hypothetical protein IPJ07_25510 [Acidobacteria bacterium]|nr:hypothetical protein [Acidobacteriota bacterium]
MKPTSSRTGSERVQTGAGQPGGKYCRWSQAIRSEFAGAGTGTVPLPIMLAYFSGVAAANAGDSTRYTSTQFANATFVNALAVNGPSVGTFSSNFTSNATFRGNGLVAGLPANFFLLNPGKLGGAWSIENNGRTWYDSIQVELRRRLSRGLLVQGN